MESGWPPRKRFTRAEVERMMEAGLFADQRYELIDGDLISKMGQAPPHAWAIHMVMVCLAKTFGIERIRVQQPLEVATEDHDLTWPEPDVAVLAEAKAGYRTRHPRGDELLLVVEVADITAKFDRTWKRDLYARAGVPEYWLLDIGIRQLIVHRKPAKGTYQQISILPENDVVAVASSPHEPIAIAGILP